MGWTRRQFLRYGASVVVGASVARGLRLLPTLGRALDAVGPSEGRAYTTQAWVEGACLGCLSACRFQFRQTDGRVVGIRPDPDRPCPWAYVLPQMFHHPDRVTAVHARVGPQGEATWKPTPTQDFIQALTRLLRERPHRTAWVFPKHTSSMTYALWRALAHTLGCPVFQAACPLVEPPEDALVRATQWPAWRWHLDRAPAILSLGADWLQAWEDFQMAQRAFRRLRPMPGALVHVGPRLSLTAMHAHRWVPCEPGTEPLIGLLIGRLLRRRGRVPPEDLSGEEAEAFHRAIEAVPLDEAVRALRVHPAVVDAVVECLGDQGALTLAPRGRLGDQWIVLWLNVLLDQVGPGRPLEPDVLIELPLPGAVEERPADELPERVGRDVDVLIFFDTNPLFESPAPRRWQKALETAETVVAFSTFWTETARRADWVVPLPLPGEARDVQVRWDGQTLQPLEVRPIRPAPFPLPDALLRDCLDALSPSAETFPWDSVDRAVADLRVRRPPDPMAYRWPSDWQWTPPTYRGEGLVLLWDLPAGLPNPWAWPHPYLYSLYGPHVRKPWQIWVEVHPETARALHLDEGDEAEVSNGSARIRARVHVAPTTPPDAVTLPLGVGHRVGAFAVPGEGSVGDLIEPTPDESGVLHWAFQRVRIRPMGPGGGRVVG